MARSWLYAALLAAFVLPELSLADVPEAPSTTYDQVAECNGALHAFIGVQDSSVRDGIVLWTCADPPRVTEPDTGQEYCGYNAVSGGQVVRTTRELRPGASVQCVFTTVFNDAENRDTKLLEAMADPANLGVKPVEVSVVRTPQRNNSRRTAQSVIEGCAAGHSAPADPPSINELRQTACFQASVSGSAPEIREELKEICRSQDLSSEERWAKAVERGAKVLSPSEKGYDEQRNLAACVAMKRLGGGVPWRKSDLLMCSRVRRASMECGCEYEIPSSVDGFDFGGWSHTNFFVPGCRKAKVDSRDYDHIVICNLTTTDIEDIELNLDFSENLRGFCKEKFSSVLPVRASIRAFHVRRQCKPDATTFCAAHSEPSPLK